MKQAYSWMAFGVGVILSAILLLYGSPAGSADDRLPLLTSLLLCEVGFIATATGFGMGLHQIIRRRYFLLPSLVMVANLALAVNFARMAVALWPETGIT